MRIVPAAWFVTALAVLLVSCDGLGAATTGATIGDSLDVAGTQRVTLLEAEVGLGGAESRPPPDGSVYASFLVRIESLSPDARYDRYRFSATSKDGRRYPYTAGGRQPTLGSGRTLPTNEVVEGWLSFEVPDDFESLSLTYEPPLAPPGESITFVVRAPQTSER